MLSILKKSILLSMFLFIFFSFSLTADIIQSQESNQNEEIVAELINLRISNNIITLKFKIRNKSTKADKINFYYKDCFIIDEKNQKKYYVLKDSEGKYIGGPCTSYSDGGRFEYWIYPQKVKSLWVKLPLPTDNPETISITLPGFLPFEGIKISSDKKWKTDLISNVYL